VAHFVRWRSLLSPGSLNSWFTARCVRGVPLRIVTFAATFAARFLLARGVCGVEWLAEPFGSSLEASETARLYEVSRYSWKKRQMTSMAETLPIDGGKTWPPCSMR
jgi:hypothetical protein